MPPNSKEFEKKLLVNSLIEKGKVTRATPRKHVLNYIPIVSFTFLHVAALYGLYLCWTSAKWPTLVFAFFLYVAAELGITAGAHRLWSHNSFKATLPLQIILMIFNTLAYQNTAIHWVKDHRLHHKYTDTDGDPHNASRGLFYSHYGWLLTKKSKEVTERGKEIDMSDVLSNPVLRFQEEYATPFIEIVCFILPTLIPVYFWGETLNIAWHVNVFRYIFNLNVSLTANSFSHKLGYRPYDKNILATNNLLINIAALGDGFHNFHHAFPWDYRSAELGNDSFNFTTAFINFFARIGWAYDLKTVPENIIEARKKRVGDGTDLWGKVHEDLGEDL